MGSNTVLTYLSNLCGASPMLREGASHSWTFYMPPNAVAYCSLVLGLITWDGFYLEAINEWMVDLEIGFMGPEYNDSISIIHVFYNPWEVTWHLYLQSPSCVTRDPPFLDTSRIGGFLIVSLLTNYSRVIEIIAKKLSSNNYLNFVVCFPENGILLVCLCWVDGRENVLTSKSA